MRRYLFIWLLFVSVATSAQVGNVKESLKLKSSILGRDVKYSVYLPPDYEQSKYCYPVLYLLHGASDNEVAWIQFGQVKATVDKLLQNNEIAPMIIVMPDAKLSWYINSFDGKVRYEDFFVKEFIPFIDSTYRTRAIKEMRAVSGLSMGGYGTMMMALRHHDLFSVAAPLSAGILTDEEVINETDNLWNWAFAEAYGKDLKGKDRLTKHFNDNNILKMMETVNVNLLKNIHFYIDCGDDDFLIKGNMALHALMINKKISHEFRVRDGEHNWTYWRSALPDVLKFTNQYFIR